jgi:hypothetical protein
MAIFLMANGVNEFLVVLKIQTTLFIKKVLRQYLISLALSLLLAFLIITVVKWILFEVLIQKKQKICGCPAG